MCASVFSVLQGGVVGNRQTDVEDREPGQHHHEDKRQEVSDWAQVQHEQVGAGVV